MKLNKPEIEKQVAELLQQRDEDALKRNQMQRTINEMAREARLKESANEGQKNVQASMQGNIKDACLVIEAFLEVNHPNPETENPNALLLKHLRQILRAPHVARTR